MAQEYLKSKRREYHVDPADAGFGGPFLDVAVAARHNNTLGLPGIADAREFSKLVQESVRLLNGKIIVDEAAREGLSPAYLQIIVNQYSFASPYAREKDKTHWVSRILRRKSSDYFPTEANEAFITFSQSRGSRRSRVVQGADVSA